MKVSEHKFSLLVLLLLLTVSPGKSQNSWSGSWSGKIHIMKGQPFTSICDADAVSVPEQFQHVTYMFISKLLPNNPSRVFMTAMYRSYGTPDRFMKIPFGRNWTIEFSGQNTGPVTRKMRIKMQVRDSKPADSGVWRCIVKYTSSKDMDSTVVASLNLAVEAPATNHVFRWEMQKLSGKPGFEEFLMYDVLNITCAVDAPCQNVSIIWRQGKFLGTGKTQTFKDYFSQGVTTSVDLPFESGSSCQRKRYTSVLKVILNKYEHNNLTFVCVLRECGKDIHIGNMTTNFTDTQPRKDVSVSASGSQKRQLTRNLFLLCLGFAVMMLQLRTDGEL